MMSYLLVAETARVIGELSTAELAAILALLAEELAARGNSDAGNYAARAFACLRPQDAARLLELLSHPRTA